MAAMSWLEKPSIHFPIPGAWNPNSSHGFGPGFRRAPLCGWGPEMTQPFYGWATAQNASLPPISSTTESTFELEETRREIALLLHGICPCSAANGDKLCGIRRYDVTVAHFADTGRASSVDEPNKKT